MEKSSSIQIANDSFLARAYAQDSGEMANACSPLDGDSTVILPMAQTCKMSWAKPANTGLLTPREMEILERLGRGLSVKGAARELSISPGTVKWHIKNIYYKLDANSREDALSKARQRKIIR